MNTLEEFLELLTGEFDNKEQYEECQQKQIDFPYAKHRNTVCNDKIKNLPKDFKGAFLVEESYYTRNQTTTSSSHLFEFEQQDDGVLLRSYEIPEGYDKNHFTYQDLKTVDFNSLKENKKFTPTLFHRVSDGFEGESESMFSPVLKFCLKEHFSKDMLEVMESMHVNGKKTFGFDEPIQYVRLK